MDDSIAHPPLRAGAFEVPAWKSALSVSSAVLLALLFIVAGTWKITDPFGAAARMVQAKVPADLGLLAAISLGIGETFAGVLLLIPRYRRWGAWVTGLLLVAFMVYIGAYYSELRGEECSCFPWLKRAVGPGFFIGDGIMLLLAVAAGLWARKSDGMRNAAIILGAVSVFALTSFGVTYARQTGIKAPDSITVNGAPQSLQHGKVFIYFFDPECSHCFQAAQAMAKYNWRGEVNLIAVPTAQPRFADQFLKDTGFTKAKVSNDLQVLKDTFKFTAGPYAVALENGRQKLGTLNFEGDEPARSLRQLDFID